MSEKARAEPVLEAMSASRLLAAEAARLVVPQPNTSSKPALVGAETITFE